MSSKRGAIGVQKPVPRPRAEWPLTRARLRRLPHAAMARAPLGRMAACLPLVAAMCFWPAERVGAGVYSPQHPHVRKIVDQALTYLETAEEDRLGGQCLIALVFLKEGMDEDHPQITRAVRECQRACRRSAKEIPPDIYSTGIAVLLLAELDASKYAFEINTFLNDLKQRQKSGGGWGYPLQHPTYGPTGDTSMTQYAVLALWTAHQHGITVSPEMVSAVCDWLLRTQNPSGAWGYQGTDPGPGNYQRVEQREIRHSLCAAGLGSTYICGDLLGLRPRQPGGRPARQRHCRRP